METFKKQLIQPVLTPFEGLSKLIGISKLIGLLNFGNTDDKYVFSEK